MMQNTCTEHEHRTDQQTIDRIRWLTLESPDIARIRTPINALQRCEDLLYGASFAFAPCSPEEEKIDAFNFQVEQMKKALFRGLQS